VTPVPFDLPLRPGEAAVLADLVFDHAERRTLNDDTRNRLAGRAANMRFESITPWFGSLERDPIHPSVYYLAVDAQKGEPLLLHLALAAAPASGFFPRSVLIARTRTVAGREIIVNAVPFGPQDRENVRKFAEQVNRDFEPRPKGAHASVALAGSNGLAAAFDAWRAILKRTGVNLASVEIPAASYHAALWAAIRAGWREGYTAAPDACVEDAREAALWSRFPIAAVPQLPALERVEKLCAAVRSAKNAARRSRSFDLEIRLDASPAPTTPEDVALCLGWLKERGCPAQLIAPRLGGYENLPALCEVARQYQAALSLTLRGDETPGILDAIGKASLGRVHLTLGSPDRIAEVAGHLAG
jgi:hypothetical protein